MRVAVTGGIGSGKSYVCGLLAKRGIRVYDCDEAAKRLMATSQELQTALKALVGADVFVGSVLQKPVLAQFILASEVQKQAVNNIVHPAVARDFAASGYDWLESAIFFDARFDLRLHVDHVVCVSAPLDLRVSRIMRRDHLSEARSRDWILRQMPQEEVIRRSDFEIINDGVRPLDPQIDEVLKQIYHQTNEKKMETILSIAGKPGLYRLVSRGKMNLIVEALDETHRRFPAFATDRVTSLADIAMYTDEEDIPLWRVLKNVGDKEQGKESALNYKKCSSKELRDYFAEVLPNYDQERVHDNDIKKLLQWYNILVKNGFADFEKILAPTEGDNVEDRKDKKDE